MKRLTGWVALAGLCASARAQSLVDYNFTGINADIPDGNLTGYASAQSISGAQTLITDLTVTLTITGTGSGAFNGDLYALLSHDGQTTVLLNRAGRTSTDPLDAGAYGYGDNGFSSVTFADGAVNGDVHNYQGVLTPSGNGPLTGTWKPDGRAVSPATVTDGTTPSSILGNFNGHNVNGAWTLLVVDAHTGGTAQLTDWSLHVTAVPEPATGALALASLLLGYAAWRKGRAS